jgi:hypothetical protein
MAVAPATAPPPNVADALTALRDIHLPSAVSWWPLAPGWWVLAGVLVVVVAATVVWLRYRRRSVKRRALAELESVAARFRSSGDPADLAAGLSTLVRRVALVRFDSREVAGLCGIDWVAFLASTGGSRGFPEEIADDLMMALYARPSAAQVDPDRWIGAVGGWIRRVS